MVTKRITVKIICCVLVVSILLIGGCLSNTKNECQSPEQVLRKYFMLVNKKNLNELKTVLYNDERFNERNLSSFLNRIKDIELLSASENNATITEEMYMSQGRGSITKPTEIKIYWVEYRVEYRKEFSADSGEKGANFILIRIDDNSPWVIDDIGL